MTKPSLSSDPDPKVSYLINLSGAFESYEVQEKSFFGFGSRANPAAVTAQKKLSNVLPAQVPNRGTMMAGRSQLSLAASSSKRLVSAFGITSVGQEKAVAARLRSSYSKAFENLGDILSKEMPRFTFTKDRWIERELAWGYSYLLAGILQEDFWAPGGLKVMNQSSSYLYQQGQDTALRDPLQHIMPMFYIAPERTKDTLLYILSNIRADGRIPYGVQGFGAETYNAVEKLDFKPSDMSLWLLWAVSEYVFATRDFAFLDMPMHGYGETTDTTVMSLLKRAYAFQVNSVGYGSHGLIRILNSDWNDILLLNSADFKTTKEKGESTLNSALATIAYPKFASLLNSRDPVFANQVLSENRKILTALKNQWKGSFYNRGYTVVSTAGKIEEVGDEALWLEANAFALLSSDALTAQQTDSLVDRMSRDIVDPRGKDAMNITAKGFESKFASPLTKSSWYSINSAAVQGLLSRGEVNSSAWSLAWSEFKRNTLASHAAAYPSIWYGIWNGSDSWFTSLADPSNAGQSWMIKLSGYAAFPSGNMHPHSQALLCAIRFAGINADAEGYIINPKLNEKVFSYSAGGTSISYSSMKAEGRLRLANSSPLKLTVVLPEGLKSAASVRATINGVSALVKPENGRAILQVTPDAGHNVRWSLE